MPRAMPRISAVARPGTHGRQDHAPHRLPARGAERQAGLAQAAGHHPQHDVRRPGDDRQDHHRQCHRRGEAGLGDAEVDDERRVDEQAGHDRRQRRHGLDDGADDPGEAGRRPRSCRSRRRRPSGSAMATAMPISISVPTIACSTPPRSNGSCGPTPDMSCVTKFRWNSAWYPRTNGKGHRGDQPEPGERRPRDDDGRRDPVGDDGAPGWSVPSSRGRARRTRRTSRGRTRAGPRTAAAYSYSDPGQAERARRGADQAGAVVERRGP